MLIVDPATRPSIDEITEYLDSMTTLKTLPSTTTKIPKVETLSGTSDLPPCVEIFPSTTEEIEVLNDNQDTIAQRGKLNNSFNPDSQMARRKGNHRSIIPDSDIMYPQDPYENPSWFPEEQNQLTATVAEDGRIKEDTLYFDGTYVSSQDSHTFDHRKLNSSCSCVVSDFTTVAPLPFCITGFSSSFVDDEDFCESNERKEDLNVHKGETFSPSFSEFNQKVSNPVETSEDDKLPFYRQIFSFGTSPSNEKGDSETKHPTFQSVEKASALQSSTKENQFQTNAESLSPIGSYFSSKLSFQRSPALSQESFNTYPVSSDSESL